MQDFTASWLLEILARHRLSPGRVIVELTEREAITDLDRLRRNVAGLQHAGVRIAADDVGAGNAGLRLLSQLRFDIVKIDLSLVQDGAQHDSSRNVLRSLMDLAARQGAVAIAEGLETAEQLRSLRELGIADRPGLPAGTAGPQREPRAGRHRGAGSRRPHPRCGAAHPAGPRRRAGAATGPWCRRARAAAAVRPAPETAPGRGAVATCLYTRGVETEQIVQSLSYITWVLLGTLALGSFALTWLLAQVTDATAGFLGFSAVLAGIFGLGWLATEWGLPVPSELAIESGAALDEPRRAAIALFAVLSIVAGVRLRRGGRARLLGGAAVVAGVIGHGARGVGMDGG